jgi:hypothetical protein
MRGYYTVQLAQGLRSDVVTKYLTEDKAYTLAESLNNRLSLAQRQTLSYIVVGPFKVSL